MLLTLSRGGRPIAKALQNKVLLTPAALDRVEAAVAEAEKAACCEIIVVFAPASSRYEGRGMRAGIGAALIVFLSVYNINTLAFNAVPEPLLLLAEALLVGVIVAIMFTRWAPLRRMLITRAQRATAVTLAAGAAFFEERAHSTVARNAVLLYVSVLEGEARILPDTGFVAEAHDAPFGEIQAALNSAQSGDAVSLVCNAVAQLGALGARHFPMAPGDSNELPDRPQIRHP